MSRDARGPRLGASLDPAAEWLSPAETAAWLRCSPKLIYRVCESDATFPAVKIGGLIRIRRSRLDRWLEHRSRAGREMKSLKAGRQTAQEIQRETNA